MIDGPKSLFNAGQKLVFEPAAVDAPKIEFYAFITSFSDNFESNWTRENTFGRMDPIQTFANTTRVINIGWKTVAATLGEAKENLSKIQNLIQILYPPYMTSPGTDIHSISGSPLLKVRLMNLIQNSHGGGLLGSLDGLTATPDFEEGAFPGGSLEQPDGTKIYPKVIQLDCTFHPLHEHLMGWGNGSNFGNNHPNFPYSATKSKPTSVNEDASADTAGLPAANAAASEQVLGGVAGHAGANGDGLPAVDLPKLPAEQFPGGG